MCEKIFLKMKSNLSLIIRREYLERVSRKSFIISTILMPVLMLGLMLAPTLIMIFSSPENKNIAVLDASGVIAPTLQDGGELHFTQVPVQLSLDSVKAMDAYDGILVIGSHVVERPDQVELYTHGAPSITTEEYIRGQLSDAIENLRLKRYDIDNLAEIIAEVKVDVQMSTYRIDREETTETSSIVSYLIGLVVAMMLYMFLMIYGQMVMTSIIEEKNNRVLEIIVSSVKPKTLMLGKIMGVGLVAVTQILIWGILICSFSKWVMPLMTSAISADSDVDLLAAVTQLGDTGYILMLFVYIMIFLMLGYLFYSTIFAAIGSAVDNIQDASQLTSIAIVPIIIGLIFSMTVANDPNSSLAFWLSIIPFTSPMVMMARIPFGIPSWEIVVSIVLLAVFSLFMVWVTAKIYRVGIFMYGKKPSLKEIIRWARYK